MDAKINLHHEISVNKTENLRFCYIVKNEW